MYIYEFFGSADVVRAALDRQAIATRERTVSFKPKSNFYVDAGSIGRKFPLIAPEGEGKWVVFEKI